MRYRRPFVDYTRTMVCVRIAANKSEMTAVPKTDGNSKTGELFAKPAVWLIRGGSPNQYERNL
jgi:hypothetical protein